MTSVTAPPWRLRDGSVTPQTRNYWTARVRPFASALVWYSDGLWSLTNYLFYELFIFRILPMHTTISSRQIQESSTNGVIWQKVNALDCHLLHKACAKVWQAKPFINIWIKSTRKMVRHGAKGKFRIVSCIDYASIVLRADSYPKTKVWWFYLKYRTQCW